jgi:hypothetical protein
MTSPSKKNHLLPRLLYKAARLETFESLPLLDSTRPGASQRNGMSLLKGIRGQTPQKNTSFRPLDERIFQMHNQKVPQLPHTAWLLDMYVNNHGTRFRGVQREQVAKYLRSRGCSNVWRTCTLVVVPKVGHAAWRNVELALCSLLCCCPRAPFRRGGTFYCFSPLILRDVEAVGSLHCTLCTFRPGEQRPSDLLSPCCSSQAQGMITQSF